MDKKTRLILFPFCKIVKGKDRSIICDFQKEKIKFIPNEMILVIEKLKVEAFHRVAEYFKSDMDIFNAYIEFLLQEGFAFFTTSHQQVTEIKNEWKSPEIINNAIIEYDFKNFDLMNLLQQLDKMLTKFIELRCISIKEKNFKELYDIISFCQKSVLRSLRLYIPYSTGALTNKIKQLPKDFSIIEHIIFYESIEPLEDKTSDKTILHTRKTLNEITYSNVNRKYLINNVQYFYECQKYNPYYNRKVSINRNGNIKNCIKNRAVFGNIFHNSLEKVIESEEFREFWFVNHDKILDIKDSELRYNYFITNDLKKVNDKYYKLI